VVVAFVRVSHIHEWGDCGLPLLVHLKVRKRTTHSSIVVNVDQVEQMDTVTPDAPLADAAVAECRDEVLWDALMDGNVVLF
jgi:hypothetical protein